VVAESRQDARPVVIIQVNVRSMESSHELHRQALHEKGIAVSRYQKHPLLYKIASRRQRLNRARGPQQLFELIDAPHHGERARFPPAVGERILTARETEVLYHVARGETDKEIAEKLFLSRRTVSNHVSSILDKLAVANRRDAVKTAFRIGLI
jgi:DNA-binding NarL/FixJ family response regulator